MVLGKGITSLYQPLGAVMVSDKVNEPFARGTYFNHGFTNQGHPVACAASLAVIDILEKDGLIDNSAKTGEYSPPPPPGLAGRPWRSAVCPSGSRRRCASPGTRSMSCWRPWIPRS